MLRQTMLVEDTAMGGEDVAGRAAGLEFRFAGEQRVAGGGVIGTMQRARFADDHGAHRGDMVVPVCAGEFERDLVSERTTAALAHKAAQGERVGQIPMGSRLAADGVHLIEDAGEQATLGDLRAMRAAGSTWQAIADALNARGVTTKKGKAWTWQTARLAGVR